MVPPPLALRVKPAFTMSRNALVTLALTVTPILTLTRIKFPHQRPFRMLLSVFSIPHIMVWLRLVWLRLAYDTTNDTEEPDPVLSHVHC